MADKIVVDDVSKLRPELLDMSEAEIQRRMTEFEMALNWKRDEANRKRREAIAKEAATRLDQISADVQWLHSNGVCPQRLVDAFMQRGGVFTPHIFLRHPKPDEIVLGVQGAKPKRSPQPRKPRDPNAPRKPRRKRNPETGKLEPRD